MTAVISLPVKVDVVRAGDREALLRLFATCSETTIVRRFFAPLRRFPIGYLDGALAGRPDEHDAVVLRYADGLHVAGLASLVSAPDSHPPTAELGVLVHDAWQRRGLGAAMVLTLLRRAADRGVERVAASVLPGRAGLLRALARHREPIGLEADGDCLTGWYRIGQEVGRDDGPGTA